MVTFNLRHLLDNQVELLSRFPCSLPTSYDANPHHVSPKAVYASFALSSSLSPGSTVNILTRSLVTSFALLPSLPGLRLYCIIFTTQSPELHPSHKGLRERKTRFPHLSSKECLGPCRARELLLQSLTPPKRFRALVQNV